MSETLLKNATIVDGSGGPSGGGDVLIRDGVIADVGANLSTSGGSVLDLDGLTLTPGFIDIHTHFDAQVLWDPTLSPSSWHGVTTVLFGNCGFGIAPTRPSDRDVALRTLQAVEGMSFDALQAGVVWDFETFPQYLEALKRRPKMINVAALLGHTPLRRYVMGEASTERAATDDEISEMRALTVDALRAGAFGFATSKLPNHVGGDGRPVPSRMAEFAELAALVESLAELNRGVLEVAGGPGLLAQESAELARRSGRPLTWPFIVGQDYAALRDGRISLNTGGEEGSARRLVDALEDAHTGIVPQASCRALSAQVTLSKPFVWGSLPSFQQIMSSDAQQQIELYSNEEWRRGAREQMHKAWSEMWDRTTIDESANNPDLCGWSLSDLAERLGSDPVDLLLDLGLEDNLETRFGIRLANDDEDVLTEFLLDDRVLVGISDAGAHADMLCDACFSTYLLSHWVRDTGRISLERAVALLSGKPAAFLGLSDRGLLRAGYAADLVAFDPATVGCGTARRVWDLPGGADRLVVDSFGIEHIWVNGEQISHGGKLIDGATSGLLLRP